SDRELETLKRRIEAGATEFTNRETAIAPYLPVREKKRLLRLMDQEERETFPAPATAYAEAAPKVERVSVAPPQVEASQEVKPHLLDALARDVIHLMLVGGSGA